MNEEWKDEDFIIKAKYRPVDRIPLDRTFVNCTEDENGKISITVDSFDASGNRYGK